jgi:hypothetical protein
MVMKGGVLMLFARDCKAIDLDRGWSVLASGQS